MEYHIIAFFSGFLLDLMFGDPYWMPHPIRLIGSLIAKVEKCFLEKKKKRDEKKELRQGVYMVIIVLLGTVTVTTLILYLAYYINCYFGMVIETIMTYQILATKCLKVESMKVYHCLKSQTLPEARKAVSMIVGRDTEALNEEGVAKAAGADVGISSTGIAGPGGGTDEKPVGLVYIGCSYKGKTQVRRFIFSGNRENNRNHTVQCALILLRDMLL